MKQLTKLQLAVISILLFSISAVAQNCFDEIDAEIRLMLVIEGTHTGGITLSESYEYISKVKVEIDTLESIGFQGYWFLRVSITERPSEWNGDIPILGDDCDGYVLALRKSGGLIHRINGFMYNDLAVIFTTPNGNSISKRKFLRTHEIKSLDLECMYSAWKSNSCDIIRYPCLQFCLNQLIIR